MIRKKRGFTVLEVVLVLAIAGLIFLMVFIALPAMQRQQRDSRRKDDMMIFVEAVKKYQSNYRGSLPKTNFNSATPPEELVAEEMNKDTIKEEIDNGTATDNSWKGFWAKYITDGFGDPQADYYGLTVRDCSTNASSATECPKQDKIEEKFDATLYVYTGGTCKEDRAVASSNPREFAVVMRTEGSGLYCFGSGS